MDDKPVKDRVRVGADGSFTVEIPLQGSPGEVTIKAEQETVAGSQLRLR